MLEIQKFIKDHDNWQELLASDPYNLKISFDEDYVLFKYDQISSDFNEEICREARGLILDASDNFSVVRMAFEKFFNIDESYADTIDWDSAVANEKIDGSVMSVWYDDHRWHLSTNGTIDAFKAELNGVSPYKTFGELFESVLPLSWFAGTLSSYFTQLCYTFELVSPYNKVVIGYPETKVYLLSVRDMVTLKEFSLNQVEEFGKRFGFATPKRYYLNNEADYRKVVESMGDGHEGIVIRDKNNNRVKIKTLLYFELHKLKNNGALTLERIVDLIRANDHYEFLSYFPEYQPMFDDIKSQLEDADRATDKVREDVSVWKSEHSADEDVRSARKTFAQEFGKSQYASLYFAEYDGRLDTILDSISTNKFISMYKIALKE